MGKKIFAPLIAAAAVGALLAGCAKPPQTFDPFQSAGEVPGNIGKIREGIQTVLFAFLDDQGFSVESGTFRNGNRADMVLLVVADTERERTTALQINPDTMVTFTPPGSGEKLETSLSLAYSYGSGGSDSCQSGMNAVSQLLGGIPIHHYVTFTADAIAAVNDMLGGVTVTAEDGGEDVTLKGEDAVMFFRFREEDDITNEDRMERQRRYIGELFPRFLESAGQEEFLTRLTFQVGEGLSTDLTLSRMAGMLELLGTCGLDEAVVTLPGSAEQVNGAYQFRADPEETSKIAEELFLP